MERPRAHAAPRGCGSVSVGGQVDRYRVAVMPDGVGVDFRHLEHGRTRTRLHLVVAGLLGRFAWRLGLDFDLPENPVELYVLGQVVLLRERDALSTPRTQPARSRLGVVGVSSG